MKDLCITDRAADITMQICSREYQLFGVVKLQPRGLGKTNLQFIVSYGNSYGDLHHSVTVVLAAPFGRSAERGIRSGCGAPSYVDVRAYGYVGADAAPGAVHRDWPAADVV